MLTARPVRPAATRRSVCRQRNAGIWMTSRTSAACSAWAGSCTSDSTGTPTSDLTAPRIRKPSLSPGPRYDSIELRFALSKEDLKMYGTPHSRAIVERARAMRRACASLSITQGPAMSASGAPAPIARSRVISTRRAGPPPGSALGLPELLAGTDEAPEEWMGEHRLRLELGMELTGQEIRVVRDLHDLHEAAVGCFAAHPQPFLDHGVEVLPVHLVSMTVTLADLRLAVGVLGLRGRHQHT